MFEFFSSSSSKKQKISVGTIIQFAKDSIEKKEPVLNLSLLGDPVFKNGYAYFCPNLLYATHTYIRNNNVKCVFSKEISTEFNGFALVDKNVKIVISDTRITDEDSLDWFYVNKAVLNKETNQFEIFHPTFRHFRDDPNLANSISSFYLNVFRLPINEYAELLHKEERTRNF